MKGEESTGWVHWLQRIISIPRESRGHATQVLGKLVLFIKELMLIDSLVGFNKCVTPTLVAIMIWLSKLNVLKSKNKESEP